MCGSSCFRLWLTVIDSSTQTPDMEGVPIRVLLVEDDAEDAGLIQAVLANAGNGCFHVEAVTQLAAALERLGQGGFHVVLLDLALADGHGVDVLARILEAAPDVVVLILSDAKDEEIARQALRRGAHDYLVKGHVDAHWLPRSLRYLLQRKLARDALRTSEERFRVMSDASPLGIFVADADGSCVYTNAAYHKISGLTFDAALGTNWSTAIHPDDRPRVVDEWFAAALSRTHLQTEFRFLQNDNRIVWTRVNAAVMRDGARSLGLVQTVEDITERKSTEFALRAAEDALFDERERARVTLNAIGDAVLTTDILGKVNYMNLVAETMTGWSWQEAMGRPLPEVFRIIDGKTREVEPNPAQRAMSEDKTVELGADCVLIRRDGFESAIEDSTAPIHNRDGRDAGAVIVFHDVSQSRAMALKMAHLAQHDFLTDLPNRVLLEERLAHAIGLGQRNRKQVALLFLDLDNFKLINDSLGHAVGDLLLQSVAARLVACVRVTDTVCRQGGDEFVILLAAIDHAQDAAHVAEKLIAAFVAPHVVGGQELHVTLSIGISIYPDDGRDVDTVMQNADTAMYHAKASGRNNFQFFRADMNTQAVRRQVVESSLRRALKHKEFVLHYQPQIDLASGALVGVEALIRWLDPESGLILPEQFVPIAEECGLIVPIGRWALQEACRQTRAWLDAGLPAVPVSVNISAVEFRHKSFLEGVSGVLQETGLAPRYLELELTESVLMHDSAASELLLQALKSLGLRLAIDDFGTGYSSLSYLKRFPIDSLKIDQSFVRDLIADADGDITTDADGAIIVSAMIGLAQRLGQRVIAEGVETNAQLLYLKSQKCNLGQGRLFSQPLPAANMAVLLR